MGPSGRGPPNIRWDSFPGQIPSPVRPSARPPVHLSGPPPLRPSLIYYPPSVPPATVRPASPPPTIPTRRPNLEVHSSHQRPAVPGHSEGHLEGEAMEPRVYAH